MWFHTKKMRMKINIKYTIFYKQLGSDLSPQICFYFQGFWRSKMLNGCLIFSPSNPCLPGIHWFSGFKTVIHDPWFLRKMLLRQLNFGALLVYQLFYAYYKGKTPLFFNLQFLLLRSEKGKDAQQLAIRGLVAYKPVAYKKN